MMRLIKQIPNFLTLCNLLSGSLAILFAFLPEYPLYYSFILVLAAALFDTFDGMAARLLHAKSAIGADLDSLSDVVSFGIAPSMIMLSALGITTWSEQGFSPFWAIIILLPALFGAFRLARFNNDTRQTVLFRGMPIPANGLFWLGYAAIAEGCPLCCQMDSSNFLWPFVSTALFSVAMSFLMVCDLPFLSVKFNFSSPGTAHKQMLLLWGILLAMLVLFVVFLGWRGFAPFVLCYALASILMPRSIKQLS